MATVLRLASAWPAAARPLLRTTCSALHVPPSAPLFGVRTLSAATADGGDGYTVTDVSTAASDDATAVKRQGWFVKKNIKGSTKKLNLLARQIRGLSANEAIAQMGFSGKGRAGVVKHAVERAVKNADFYHGLSSDELRVAEAFVGKGLTAPRIRFHGRGRHGKAHLRFSRLTVRLEEMSEEERQRANKFTRSRPVLKHLKGDPRYY